MVSNWLAWTFAIVEVVPFGHLTVTSTVVSGPSPKCTSVGFWET